MYAVCLCCSSGIFIFIFRVFLFSSFFFFFSSRRRHTRCSRDWSSDVCSSDLFVDQVLILAEGHAVARGAPVDVLTRETAAAVFQWPVVISAFDGRPQMIPLRKKENHP